MNVSRPGRGSICTGTSYVELQSWKGCLVLCHLTFIELETDSKGRTFWINLKQVGSNIDVSGFPSQIFFCFLTTKGTKMWGRVRGLIIDTRRADLAISEMPEDVAPLLVKFVPAYRALWRNTHWYITYLHGMVC